MTQFRREFVLPVLCLLVPFAAGCVSVDARPSFLRNTVRDRVDRYDACRTLDKPSHDLLSRQGLLLASRNEPDGAAAALEARLLGRPEPAGSLALAELSYRGGLARESADPDTAIDRYRDAAILAALSLGTPDAPGPEAAVEIHNKSLARLIRVSQRADVRRGRDWRKTLADHGLSVTGVGPNVDPGRFDELVVADDVQVSGMRQVFRTWGLGVPLVTSRTIQRDREPEPQETYFPLPLRVGLTATVVPSSGFEGGAWRRCGATLALHDAFDDGPVRVGAREVPLAHDRTVALATQIGNSVLPLLELSGLFRASFVGEVQAGLYMMRPYERGKIPVVLVHGLYSSPRAFAQTINELSNDPVIGKRFQFWVFLYPSGMPITASAARLRGSLLQARETLDPAGTDEAFDRSILVGHSMGGLLSKMMVQDSGPTLWDAAIDCPPERLVATPQIVRTLTEALVFQPVPFVKRVVFIATPHHGSLLANRPVGRLVSRLIQGPGDYNDMVRILKRLNGRDVMTPSFRGDALDSVQELRTDSVLLSTLDRIPIEPTVPYHSIIPVLADWVRNDGIVPYASAHLDGAVSEKVIQGTHSAQQSVAATDELRRILRIHAALPAAGD